MIVPVCRRPTVHAVDAPRNGRMIPVTVAVSWTLVPTNMLAGAPEIETVGTAGETASVTVAVGGVCGNSLLASMAT